MEDTAALGGTADASRRATADHMRATTKRGDEDSAAGVAGTLNQACTNSSRRSSTQMRPRSACRDPGHLHRLSPRRLHVLRGVARGVRGACSSRASASMPSFVPQVLESIYPTELSSAYRHHGYSPPVWLRLMQRIIRKGGPHRCRTRRPRRWRGRAYVIPTCRRVTS